MKIFLSAINFIKLNLPLINILQTRYAKRKDEELVKMSIGVRRDMEEKMKIERNTLKEVLTNQNKRDLESAVDRKKLVEIGFYFRKFWFST